MDDNDVDIYFLCVKNALTLSTFELVTSKNGNESCSLLLMSMYIVYSPGKLLALQL